MSASDLERRLAYVGVLERTATAAGACQTLEEAAQVALDEVCAFTGWPVGVLYRRNGAGLVPTDVWHLDDPDRFGDFRRLTGEAGMSAGRGLTRRLVPTGEAAWLADIADEPEFPGAEAATAAGLRSAFGLPIATDEGVEAVLALFATDLPEPDVTTFDLLATVAVQLRAVVEREHVMRALHQSEERYRALAQSFERQLADQTLRDHLTGLPNRAVLLDRLDMALARAGRERTSVGVLLLDLDRFKAVNDTRGYQVGDELLRAVAARLQRLVRPGDTVARMSSDEIAVLIEDLGDREEAAQLATRALSAFADGFQLPSGSLAVTASAGLTVAAGDTPDRGLLLSEADAALDRARQRGPAALELFDEEMRTEAALRQATEQDLRRAIGTDQLMLHYQPIVSLGTGDLFGAEALVRWDHPVRGLLGPGEFVPLAEETGLIVPLGRWVLAEATRQAAEWREKAPQPALTLSVNVSGHEFQEADWTDEVVGLLAKAGIGPHELLIEITESALVEDTELAAERLRALQRRVGVRLAIDDFGTGYSSLGYLRHLPVDILKIDKSFIEGITEGPHESALARAVLKLARTLDLQTVAEGVEHAEQLVMLQRLGCQLGQGFHLGRPLHPEAITDML